MECWRQKTLHKDQTLAFWASSAHWAAGCLRCDPLRTLIPKPTLSNLSCLCAQLLLLRSSWHTCNGLCKEKDKLAWKTVGVRGGWQGLKVTDPDCRWSTKKMERILLHHEVSRGSESWQRIADRLDTLTLTWAHELSTDLCFMLVCLRKIGFFQDIVNSRCVCHL